MNHLALWRRLLSEFVGSALLAALVIGSGIAAQQLSPGNIGLQLLENAGATAAGLYAIILVLSPVSGAHLNPVVSLADALEGGTTWRDALSYIPFQIVGCVAGAVLANVIEQVVNNLLNRVVFDAVMLVLKAVGILKTPVLVGVVIVIFLKRVNQI